MSEPNARRTTHLTRDAAWELLTRYNKDAFHLHHAETVEKTMRYFARELGYAEDEDYWGIVGMLHDIDFEQWPQQPCVKSQTLLKRAWGRGLHQPGRRFARLRHRQRHRSRTRNGEDPLCRRRIDGASWCRRADVSLEKRKGPEPEEREEEVQGQEIRRRLLARRDTARGGSARLGVG